MKLSIITVNLNNREGLQKTIDSVICQTFRDLEWIVIDGGSTDGSKELIEQYADHFAYWVSEPDKGVYNAMNKGIKVAKGEYLQFLNSGDWLFEDNVLEKVFTNELTEDFIYCDDGGCTGVIVNGGSPSIIDFRFLYTYTICHQTIFHKRSLFDKGLFDEKYKIVADWKFLFQHIVKNDATYRKLSILLCVLQEGSSYDTSRTEMERQTVIHEFYSQLERDFIEKYLTHSRTHHYELTSYIESQLITKKWFRRLIKIFKQ
jgi:glycosyltransferase involved in cell wall biosynthesis